METKLPVPKTPRGRDLLAALAIVALAPGMTAFMFLRSSPLGPAEAIVHAATTSMASMTQAPMRNTTKKVPPPDAPLPPLRLNEYTAARPLEQVRTVFEFAARRPDILQYVPCFCGCQAGGHRANDDCFVAARDAEGRVTAWEPHGISCTICLDVARDAMQLNASGASITQIRAIIEKKYRPLSPTITPTPMPPSATR